ncbi:MAG: EF-P beta-lysylation protein EpmB [Pseudohongiellaceae bacterium]
MPEKWQQILSDLITEPKELVEILGLNPEERPPELAALAQFPLKAPRPFVSRIERGNWEDPLLRQIWPAGEEAVADPALNTDPLEETRFNPAPGLLQKYRGRVLLSVAPHCAVHCRYCFRRHFDYAANTPGRRQWRQALTAIAEDATITEVIFSGGDPLAVPDRQLRWLLGELDAIPQLTTLRIHSRLPIVIPQRITPSLRALLQGTRLQVVLVLHVNHARELDHAVAGAMSELQADGLTLLNQSVLLAGVNDSVTALAELSHALFRCHVLPYYLHMPDPVAGTSHFQVSEARARRLMASLRARLPGYLVPRLVREIPGRDAKTTLA